MNLLMKASGLLTWLLPVSILVGLVAGWELWVRLADVPKWQLPAPSEIAKELGSSSSLLWEHTLVTLEEIVVGFLAALVAGLVLAGATPHPGPCSWTKTWCCWTSPSALWTP